MLWEYDKNDLVKNGDYLFAKIKNHPKANKHGYVYEHRIVIENNINRILNDNEIVHHKNGNKKDNDINNLELLNNVEHICHHNDERKGRTFVELKCPFCKKLFEKEKRNCHLSKKGQEFTFCSRSCNKNFYKSIPSQEIYLTAFKENVVREYKQSKIASSPRD